MFANIFCFDFGFADYVKIMWKIALTILTYNLAQTSQKSIVVLTVSITSGAMRTPMLNLCALRILHTVVYVVHVLTVLLPLMISNRRFVICFMQASDLWQCIKIYFVLMYSGVLGFLLHKFTVAATAAFTLTKKFHL